PGVGKTRRLASRAVAVAVDREARLWVNRLGPARVRDVLLAGLLDRRARLAALETDLLPVAGHVARAGGCRRGARGVGRGLDQAGAVAEVLVVARDLVQQVRVLFVKARDRRRIGQEGHAAGAVELEEVGPGL